MSIRNLFICIPTLWRCGIGVLKYNVVKGFAQKYSEIHNDGVAILSMWLWGMFWADLQSDEMAYRNIPKSEVHLF